MIGTTLSHYQIVDRLGSGGMGEVYLAEDLRLKRQVALKVLPAERLGDPERKQRFVQEARAAAAIEHPNIAAVYEIDEVGEQVFIAMEYVRGESLRSFIEDQKLTMKRTVEIARQIADALGQVHERGIMHRDLKPDNVLVSHDGRVKLIDFGLAKLFQGPLFEDAGQSEVETASQLIHTREGVVQGTVTYMAPEQARGERVDARCDVFSFGVVLYEMLTGRAPFKRETTLDTLSAILKEAPAPMDLKAGRAGKLVETVVRKALAKDPADRYQDFRALSTGLGQVSERLLEGSRPALSRVQRVASLLAVALAVGFALWVLAVRNPPTVGAQEPLSLLVADFDNQTGEALFDGALEQAMAIGLEGASFVTAYSREDARRDALRIDPTSDGTLDERMAQLVCRSVGIKVAVTGSIELDGGDYELSVRALDPVSSNIITEATEEGISKVEVLRAADRLASELRTGLGERSRDSSSALEGETFVTASLEAMKAYADAQALYKVGKYDEAIEAYRGAIAYDPDFGRAYSGIASNLANMGRTEEAKRYYELALTKIDRMTERGRYRTRGAYYLFSRQPENAIQEFEALVEKFPADTAAHSNLALAYFYQRNMAGALEFGKRSVEIYPNNLLERNNLALYAMYAGDFEAARSEAEHILELNPSFVKAYVTLGLSQSGLGELDAAEATYQRLASQVRSAHAASTSAVGLADVALYRGRLDAAVDILERGLAGDRANDNRAGAARKLASLARAHLFAGRVDDALSAAREASELSTATSVLVPVARVFTLAGAAGEARAIATELGERLQSDPQTYAKLLEGEVLLERGDPAGAIRLFLDAQAIADTWLGRFLLGRAYIEAGAFVEAHSELERCLSRVGEASAIFLDDVPSFHYFPPVYYYLAVAQDGLGSEASRESFQRYVAIREGSDRDTLLVEARRQLAVETEE